MSRYSCAVGQNDQKVLDEFVLVLYNEYHIQSPAVNPPSERP